MNVKTNGVELKAFYEDQGWWPEDRSVWHEEVHLIVNGTTMDEDLTPDDLEDGDAVVITDGIVYFEGRENEQISFGTYFKRWRKQRSVAHLLVTVDKDRLESVKAAIKSAGGRIN